MLHYDITYDLVKISSLRFVISAIADVRASSFPTVSEATSSYFKLDSFSISNIFSLSELSSDSRTFFESSAYLLSRRQTIYSKYNI